VGFLFRNASGGALRGGVRSLLAEQAVRPSYERTHGAGLLLAEAVAGVANGLHSRAPAVLALLLQQDLLKPGDFAAAAARRRQQAAQQGGQAGQAGLEGAAQQELDAAAAAQHALDLDAAPEQQQEQQQEQEEQQLQQQQGPAATSAAAAAPGGSSPSREQLRARAAAVASVALDRLLDHLRRGKCEALWAALLAEAGRRLAALAAAVKAGGGEEGAAARAGAARCVDLLAQAVHFYRGSRVEDYAPLLALCKQLVEPTFMQQQGGQPPQQQQQPQPQQAGGQQQGAEPYLEVSLSEQAFNLMLGLALGHTKAVGASQGLQALARHAPAWAPAFSRAPAPELLQFVRGLVQPPGGAELVGLFAPQVLGALGRLVMGQAAGAAALEAPGGGGVEDSEQALALALLVDVCTCLRPDVGAAAGVGLPLLLTAQPGGVKLAAYVKQLPGSCLAPEAPDQRMLAAAWAGLQLLPHACESREQAAGLAEAAASRSRQLHQQQAGDAQQGLLLLHSSALQLLAALATPAQLQPLAEQAMAWALQHPGNAAAVKAAADVLAAAGPGQGVLTVARLQAALPAFAANLAAPQLALRTATLQLLAAFPQPHMVATGEREQQQVEGELPLPPRPAGGLPCDTLPVLLAISTQPCTIENGRRWAVALERVAGHFEYARCARAACLPCRLPWRCARRGMCSAVNSPALARALQEAQTPRLRPSARAPPDPPGCKALTPGPRPPAPCLPARPLLQVPAGPGARGAAGPDRRAPHPLLPALVARLQGGGRGAAGAAAGCLAAAAGAPGRHAARVPAQQRRQQQQQQRPQRQGRRQVGRPRQGAQGAAPPPAGAGGWVAARRACISPRLGRCGSGKGMRWTCCMAPAFCRRQEGRPCRTRPAVLRCRPAAAALPLLP
jgi:hypothetical protein